MNLSTHFQSTALAPWALTADPAFMVSRGLSALRDLGSVARGDRPYALAKALCAGVDLAALDTPGLLALHPRTRQRLQRAWPMMEEAAILGHEAAQFGAACLCYSGAKGSVDEAQAFLWFEACARRGLLAAQSRLGELLLYGRGVPAQPAEALRWLRLAAEQGCLQAQFHVGVCFAEGRGVKADATQEIGRAHV